MDTTVAKLFNTADGQFVRLPMELRFEETEVFVRRDPKTGDVILSRKPKSWDGLIALHGRDDTPIDFMDKEDRMQLAQNRDPFAQ